MEQNTTRITGIALMKSEPNQYFIIASVNIIS